MMRSRGVVWAWFIGLLLVASEGIGAEARQFQDIAYVENPQDRQRVDVYVPVGVEKPPLVVWVHGGAWRAGDKKNVPRYVRSLLERGFAVASVGYRLSQEVKFPAQIEDVKAAVRFLRASEERFGFDAERIGAIGHSAGGHLVSLLGTTVGVREFEVGENLEESSAVQAVAPYAGPSDLLKMDEQGGRGHNAPNSPESQLIGGAIQENREAAARANPITYIEKQKGSELPSFFIVHGEEDRTVPVGQAEILHEALEKAGAKTKLKKLPGAGHGGPAFQSPKLMDELAGFFTRELRGGEQAWGGKPRLLVLTDIGGDPDDQQSMVRLMHYANEFEIEGLIASASGTPGELKEAVTKAELIREIVGAYGKVRENLAKHAEGYPDMEKLLGVIKSGNPQRGLKAIGEDHDTEGSKWIIEQVDRADARPLNIAIWGGQTDLAQALWRVRKERGTEGLKKFVGKFRVHDIADQDKIVEWMWKEFPGMFYVLDKAPEGADKREAAFRGMYLGGDLSLVSREWMEKNIRQEHGPLGALYPPRTWTAPNPHSAIKEGDTPSWFYFLENGLNDPAHPEWGGWGGRYEKARDEIYRDARDQVGEVKDARATVWRWRPAFQADFQARMDWGAGKAEVNHAPVAILNGDESKEILKLKAKAGDEVKLSAEGSRDPDGDKVKARWFIYPEAGSYRGKVGLRGERGERTSFEAPQVIEPESIHVILELTDEGAPQLKMHRRAVVTVTP